VKKYYYNRLIFALHGYGDIKPQTLNTFNWQSTTGRACAHTTSSSSSSSSLYSPKERRVTNSELDSRAGQHGSKKATLIVAREEKIKYTIQLPIVLPEKKFFCVVRASYVPNLVKISP